MAAPSFATFGAEHFIALAVTVGGGVALACAVRAAGSAKADRVARWALGIGCLGFEAGALAWWALARHVSLRFLLPLHLCDVSILIAPFVLLTGNRYAFELLYFWGIGGAMQALATPAVRSGFPSPACLLFFLGHGLIVASALHATLVMRLRPTLRSVLRVWLITNAYGLLIIPVNWALGTNYLYIMEKPATPSLLDLMGPWPWYVVVVDVVALVVIVLCYLPFFLHDRWLARAR